jgi:hypothetical protein
MLIISRIRYTHRRCTTYSEGHYRLQGSNSALCGATPGYDEHWDDDAITMDCAKCRLVVDRMVVKKMEDVKV